MIVMVIPVMVMMFGSVTMPAVIAAFGCHGQLATGIRGGERFDGRVRRSGSNRNAVKVRFSLLTLFMQFNFSGEKGSVLTNGAFLLVEFIYFFDARIHAPARFRSRDPSPVIVLHSRSNRAVSHS
jgi:hypothetical protein